MIKLHFITLIILEIQIINLIEAFTVNQDNCKNNVTFEKCFFKIDIQNYSNNPISCFMKFKNPGNNSIMLDIYEGFKLRSQAGNTCPFFALILSVKPVPQRIAATCGGDIPVLHKKFLNVDNVLLMYDNRNIKNDNIKLNVTMEDAYTDKALCKDDEVQTTLFKRKIISTPSSLSSTSSLILQVNNTTIYINEKESTPSLIWVVIVVVLVVIIIFVILVVVASMIIGNKRKRKRKLRLEDKKPNNNKDDIDYNGDRKALNEGV